ncbi:MAG: FtsX-like permease family protein, partial [Betaproteobacteria bacterium]|nr:FtsX-like permease family protein [Betaproteobacteria bacterium]
ATGLVQPASRITYRFAVAANDAAITNGDARVARFVTWVREWIEREQVRGARLETVESGRPEMRQTLDRADKFLRLVALLAALLSAVAVALAARGFASRHLDDCAMLRVLGQSQRTLTIAFAVEFLLVGLIASLLGVVLGYAVHHVFVWLLAGLVASQLPPASLWPALLGAGMGMTLLAAFGLPPVLQLARVPALRVMRRDVGQLRPASVAVLAVGVAGFAALLLAASSDLKLGLIAVAGFAVAVLLFAVLGAAAVWLLRRSVNEATAPRWLVLATRQMSARPAYAVVQVSALAAGLLALVLLVLLRTDLIASWQKATPPDAPNRFVINIMPEQASAFRQALDGEGIRGYDWYPMIRGRLIGVNGRSVTPEDFADDRAQRLVDREFNLSHSEQAPAHNEIVAGRWVPGERNAISMEDGIARSLGLKLGDEVRFDIAGVPVDARITSLRKVDWGSLRANFFVMYPVADMGNLPLSYMSAFRAPLARAGERSFDNRLVQAFPNVTNVDMTATLTQVQSVLGQVIRAVEFLFGFTLMAGLVVLFAAVTATREDRAREFAVMRAVGASAALLRQVQRAELAGVGLLAGMLASIVAVAIGWALARYAFEFAWTASWWVVLAGGACGAALALAAGWWGLRDVLRRPVVDTLRRAAQ